MPVRQYELFVGENLSPHIDHYTMIGAVDINGFVKEACQSTPNAFINGF